jgi:hypothetical protein
VDNFARFAESLREDLTAWQKATEGPPLNKHASQVAGIVGQLTGALAGLEAAEEGVPGELEQAIGDYLHIWDFFRSKLALRYVPWYQAQLAVADDLAWAAFQPIRDAAAGHVSREPPLVYFSRGVVPFTVTRGQNYQNLLPRGGLWTERSEVIADHLVVPVISLPWQRFSSLSVLLSVAHEVGHVVVSDLNLLPVLQARLANATLAEARRPLWSAWLEEVFADIFSAVVCGSPVALSLIDQLTSQPGVTGPPDMGPYPPVELRARMILHVAERRGDLGNQPRPQPPRDEALADFEADLASVAEARLDAGFPQMAGQLENLYPPVDGTGLRADIDRLRRGRDPQASDIRILLAAAAATELAFPADYDRRQAGELALRRAAGIRDVTRRGRGDGQTQARRDQQAGRELAKLLIPPIPT